MRLPPRRPILWRPRQLSPPPPPRGAATTTNRPATGQHCPAPPVPPTWAGLLGEGDGGLRTQRELSLPVHAAARARLYEDFSLSQRAALAACLGHGAAAWLSAMPSPRVTGTAIYGTAMRVAVRVWLGAPSRSDPPSARCRCGAAVDEGGFHFLGACVVQRDRHQLLHNHIVPLLAAALRQAGVWRAVAVEVGLDWARTALRPDLRATRVATCVVVWGDVSIASPFTPEFVPRVVGSPLRAVAAEAREAYKVSKYAPALFVTAPAQTFTPLVWEVFGRVGPQTAAWLRTALGVPGRSPVRHAFLTAASVALWRSIARGVSDGYAATFGSRDPAGLGTGVSNCFGVNYVVVGESRGLTPLAFGQGSEHSHANKLPYTVWKWGI
eukprot:TRINITY_DN916_c0_g1_i3.p2 TRINITY_DN916_c0_g1~~TRINITY_DN916_c0_g1_i3.p2  ORF type:complete len:382 (-),score=39.89 TRINITY_DN916_c0_g1_i3:15-1160(-)